MFPILCFLLGCNLPKEQNYLFSFAIVFLAWNKVPGTELVFTVAVCR